MRRTLGIGLAATLALCAMLAAPATPAGATRGLLTGFSDPDEYQGFDTAARPLWMQRTKASGAGVVRLAVQWDKIAAQRPADPTDPADPAYDFSSVDGAARDAAAAGLEILLTINKSPPWAEGPGRPSTAAEGTWRPNIKALADFSQALATRFSGDFSPPGSAPFPRARYIEVWDEPNSSDWLNPQFEGRAVVGPDYYRSMLNASYRSIKSVDSGIQVVTGGTDPYGDPPGGPYPPGSQRVWPVLFWEKVLCVHPVKGKKPSGNEAGAYARAEGCPPAQFDILAHHPIDNTGGGPLKSGPNKNDASTPDLDRVVRVLRAAEQLGTVPAGPHPVWVTEFWWDSRPPNPVGAPLGTQARWIEQSFYLFWKAGASAAINFQIADSTARPDVHAGLQAGIFFRDGRPKPSFTAFRFPFVTERVSDLSLRAWGKSPVGGRLVIQRRKGRTWVPVKTLQVNRGAVFDTRLNLRGDQLLRARVGDDTSLPWRQGESGKSDSGGGLGAGTIALLVLAAILVAVGAAAVVLRRRGTPGAS